MEKKVTYLQQEDEVIRKAKKALRDFVDSGYSQNPIKAQFAAFQKAKRNINLDDLI